MAYDTSGRVDTVKDATGRGLDLTYTSGLITKVATVGDTAVRAVTFAYDSATTTKNLISVTDPEGKLTALGIAQQ
jgi:hypothetical protein